MRRTLAGLVAVGVLVVGGCSDGDDETSADEDSTTTQAAESGGEGAASTEVFCDQFRRFDEQFANDPGASLQQVVEAMQSLEPPEEIAADFQLSLEANEALAGGEQPQNVEEVSAANGRIQSFVVEQCGFDPSANDTDTTQGEPQDGGTDGSGTETTTGPSTETTAPPSSETTAGG